MSNPQPPPHIMAIIALIAALDSVVGLESHERKPEGESSPRPPEHEENPDNVLLLGVHPDQHGIGVCAPCNKSILQTMQEADEAFRQSKDDRLSEFTAVGVCPCRPDRYHIVFR
jgi:hypothetical protein